MARIGRISIKRSMINTRSWGRSINCCNQKSKCSKKMKTFLIRRSISSKEWLKTASMIKRSSGKWSSKIWTKWFKTKKWSSKRLLISILLEKTKCSWRLKSCKGNWSLPKNKIWLLNSSISKTKKILIAIDSSMMKKTITFIMKISSSW